MRMRVRVRVWVWVRVLARVGEGDALEDEGLGKAEQLSCASLLQSSKARGRAENTRQSSNTKRAHDRRGGHEQGEVRLRVGDAPDLNCPVKRCRREGVRILRVECHVHHVVLSSAGIEHLRQSEERRGRSEERTSKGRTAREG